MNDKSVKPTPRPRKRISTSSGPNNVSTFLLGIVAGFVGSTVAATVARDNSPIIVTINDEGGAT